MAKLVSVTDAGGRVQRFDPAIFISARDSLDGICLVQLAGHAFGTTKSAAEVEAAVKEALSGGG